MSKFIRIEEAALGNDETFMLNLDLVATAKLSPQEDYSGKAPPRAYLLLSSVENLVLASFYLNTMEDGKRWVLQHLGIEL